VAAAAAAAADPEIGNAVLASFQILPSVTHALNAMVPKVEAAAEEEAAMEIEMVADILAVAVDTDEEIVHVPRPEVVAGVGHADLEIGSAASVSFQILPPENAVLSVQHPKTPHFDNQTVPSPAVKILRRQRRA